MPRTRSTSWPHAAAAILAIAGATAGCEAPAASARRGPADAPSALPAAPAGAGQAEFLVGPDAARQLGYRIDWEAWTTVRPGTGIRHVSLQDDSVYVLDGGNFLTRLRRDDGSQLWRIPIADASTEILGITYIGDLERICLTAADAVHVLDAATGSPLARQKLDQIAGTAPAAYGRFLIYGARSGQVVWHSYELGYQWKAYQVAAAIRVAPVVWRDDLVAVGADGSIMALDAATGLSMWSRSLLEEIAAAPVIGEGMVYIAGRDQYLWAFDVGTGRRVWRYLSESPLVDSPVLIDDRVYQQIPDQGLACFEARPLDKPGGSVIWVASGVTGSVVNAFPDRLVVWDARSRRIATLDPASGGLMEAVALPSVKYLHAGAAQSGNLLAASDDGRVARLVARR